MQSKRKLTETALRKPFISALRDTGAIVIPYVGSTYGVTGTPDIFVAHLMWSGWIEFKGPNTRIEPIQQRMIDSLRKRNVKVEIVRLHGPSTFTIEGIDYTYNCGRAILEILSNVRPPYCH